MACYKPMKDIYEAVVKGFNATKRVGGPSVFERARKVPVTHMAYFKANTDEFMVEIKYKDQWSAEGWKYVNSAGVWIEAGWMSLEVAKV